MIFLMTYDFASHAETYIISGVSYRTLLKQIGRSGAKVHALL
jgi:hypothetical protein